MRPQIIEFMKSFTAFTDRFVQLASMLREMDSSLPGLADHNYIDIALLSPVSRVLSVPYDQEISESDWTHLRQVVPVAFGHWRHGVDSGLSIIIPELAYVFRQFETLDHPTTLFRCCKCSDSEMSPVVAYADMISHGCCNKPFHLDRTPRQFPVSGVSYYNAAVFHFQNYPWSDTYLKLHTRGWNLGKSIMIHLGAHPYMASREQIDSLGTQFACVDCGETEPTSTMNWPNMVSIQFTRFDGRLSLVALRTGKPYVGPSILATCHHTS